jgi:hypothetical protein
VDTVLLLYLASRPGMSATRVREYLEARAAARLRERVVTPLAADSPPLDLSAYNRVNRHGQQAGQGVSA